MNSLVEAAVVGHMQGLPAHIEHKSGFEMIDCWTLIHVPAQRSFLFLFVVE